MPKICHSKIFWTIVSAGFAFTLFTYGVVNDRINTVDAEVSKRTEIIYTIPPAIEKLDKIDDKTDKLIEDVGYIKGKLEKLD